MKKNKRWMVVLAAAALLVLGSVTAAEAAPLRVAPVVKVTPAGLTVVGRPGLVPPRYWPRPYPYPAPYPYPYPPFPPYPYPYPPLPYPGPFGGPR